MGKESWEERETGRKTWNVTEADACSRSEEETRVSYWVVRSPPLPTATLTHNQFNSDFYSDLPPAVPPFAEGYPNSTVSQLSPSTYNYNHTSIHIYRYLCRIAELQMDRGERRRRGKAFLFIPSVALLGESSLHIPFLSLLSCLLSHLLQVNYFTPNLMQE